MTEHQQQHTTHYEEFDIGGGLLCPSSMQSFILKSYEQRDPTSMQSLSLSQLASSP